MLLLIHTLQYILEVRYRAPEPLVAAVQATAKYPAIPDDTDGSGSGEDTDYIASTSID